MSGAEVPLIATAVVGGGAQIYGQIASAQAKKDAAEKEAALKGMQADEILQRQAINEQTMLEQSDRIEKDYGASLGAVHAGGGIGGIMQIHANTLDNIKNSRRDAEFKSKMLRLGADIETSLASDAITASYISGAGTFLTSAAQSYSTFKGPGKAKGIT